MRKNRWLAALLLLSTPSFTATYGAQEEPIESVDGASELIGSPHSSVPAPDVGSGVIYHMLIIEPDSSVDYKIRVFRPDPSIRYYLRIIDPNAGRETNGIGGSDFESAECLLLKLNQVQP